MKVRTEENQGGESWVGFAGDREPGRSVWDELEGDLQVSRGQSGETVGLCALVQSPEVHSWVREREVQV